MNILTKTPSEKDSDTSSKEIIEREALALRKTLYRSSWIGKLIILLDAALYVVAQVFATQDGTLVNDPFTYYKWTLAFYYVLMGVCFESIGRLDFEHYIISTTVQIIGLAGAICWGIGDIALIAVDLNYIWTTDTNIMGHAHKLTTFVICDLFQVFTKVAAAGLVIYALPKLRTHDVRRVQSNLVNGVYTSFEGLANHASAVGANIRSVLSHADKAVAQTLGKSAGVADPGYPVQVQQSPSNVDVGRSSSTNFGIRYGGATRITRQGITSDDNMV